MTVKSRFANMPVITIDYRNFVKGFSTNKYLPDGGYSPESSGVDPLRRFMEGVLQMGRLPVDTSTGLGTSDIKASCYSYNSSAGHYYSIGSDGNIYETLVSTGAHTLKAYAAVKTYGVNTDIIVYGSNIYVSSTTDILISANLFTATDEDWWTTTAGGDALTAGVPHKFKIFKGVLYCTNGNKLVSWDGSNHNDAALTLPVGWIITDMDIDNSGILRVVASFGSTTFATNSKTREFTWNGYSSSYLSENDLKLPCVGAVVNMRTGMHYLTTKCLYTPSGKAYKYARSSGDVNFHEIAVYDDVIYFVADGGVMAYDTLRDALYQPLYTDVAINALMIGYMDRIDFFANSKFYKDGGNMYLGKFYSNFYGFPQNALIQSVKIIYNSVLATGASYTFTLQNEIGGTINAKNITFAADGAKTIVSYNVNVKAEGFKLLAEFKNAACSAINSIKIYYAGAEGNTNR